jgi:hypothetical protein
LNSSFTFSEGIPILTRKEVKVNRPTCERWRLEDAASYKALMQGGKASCITTFGNPSISAVPILSTANFFILSAMAII